MTRRATSVLDRWNEPGQSSNMPETRVDQPSTSAGTWLLASLPLALIYGVLSALRWPQTYALSHMMIDYHFGFGKRGLIGAVLGLIDKPPYHYVTLAWMAFSVSGLWLVLLGCAAWDGVKRDRGIAAAVMLFFLSAGFSSLVCDVGRGEHFGLLLALPCLLMPQAPSWLALRVALAVAALLAQEANYFIIVPLIVFDACIGLGPGSGRRALLTAAAVLLPASLLTYILGNFKTACGAEALTHFQHMAADFSFQAVPLVTLCIDGKTNLGLVAQDLWSIGTQFMRLPLAFLVVLPSTLFNLVLLSRIVPGRPVALAAAIVVAVSPVAVIAFGVDVERFMTLVQATSLLALVSAARRIGLPPQGTLARLPSTATILALASFQLGTAVTLTDGTQPLKFPFAPLAVRALSVAQGHEPFVLIQ